MCLAFFSKLRYVAIVVTWRVRTPPSVHCFMPITPRLRKPTVSMQWH